MAYARCCGTNWDVTGPRVDWVGKNLERKFLPSLLLKKCLHTVARRKNVLANFPMRDDGGHATLQRNHADDSIRQIPQAVGPGAMSADPDGDAKMDDTPPAAPAEEADTDASPEPAAEAPEASPNLVVSVQCCLSFCASKIKIGPVREAAKSSRFEVSE